MSGRCLTPPTSAVRAPSSVFPTLSLRPDPEASLLDGAVRPYHAAAPVAPVPVGVGATVVEPPPSSVVGGAVVVAPVVVVPILGSELIAVHPHHNVLGVPVSHVPDAQLVVVRLARHIKVLVAGVVQLAVPAQTLEFQFGICLQSELVYVLQTQPELPRQLSESGCVSLPVPGERVRGLE